MNNMVFAFAMTVMAGACTGIGSMIAFLSKSTNKVFLSVSLGFSAGVMVYVSMIEIFVKAQEILTLEIGARSGATVTVLGFFGGMFLIAIIDKLLPEAEQPYEVLLIEGAQLELDDRTVAEFSGLEPDGATVAEDSGVELGGIKAGNRKLMRMGIFTAAAIAIHNFPEGLATFISAMQEPEVGIPIVVAIAMHNIPEGIAVSVPIYHATGSKKKAFLYSFGSGLSEPMGALIGWLILMPIMSDTVYGILFAGVAGIMVFISLDELLPCAREYGSHQHAMCGMVGGMIVMAISLLLFI